MNESSVDADDLIPIEREATRAREREKVALTHSYVTMNLTSHL